MGWERGNTEAGEGAAGLAPSSRRRGETEPGAPPSATAAAAAAGCAGDGLTLQGRTRRTLECEALAVGRGQQQVGLCLGHAHPRNSMGSMGSMHGAHPATATAAAAAAALEAGDIDCSHLAARLARALDPESPAEGVRAAESGGKKRSWEPCLSKGWGAVKRLVVSKRGSLPAWETSITSRGRSAREGMWGVEGCRPAQASGQALDVVWRIPGVLWPDSLAMEPGRSQLAVSRGVCQGTRVRATQRQRWLGTAQQRSSVHIKRWPCDSWG